MLAMVAFSVDVGYMLSVKEELQRTADATALATVWDYGKNLVDKVDYQTSESNARQTAQQYATTNIIANGGPLLDQNANNSCGWRFGLWLCGRFLQSTDDHGQRLTDEAL